MNQNDWINLLFATNQERPNGIVFGNTRFSEPVRLSFFLPPFGGGIYAILVPDSTAKPRLFRVIYFGQSGKLQERVTRRHEKYRDWLSEAESDSNLYASYYETSGGEHKRSEIERQLIERYRPICNDIHNPQEVMSREFYKLLAQMK
jgi:hypothetical protein